MMAFGVIDAAAEEVVIDDSYDVDNAQRPAHVRSLVIQRTLSGAAYYEDAGGRVLVPAGFAMLLAHQEPTRYGFPPASSEPYRLRFLSFTIGTSLREAFLTVRAEFGAIVQMPDESEATALFNDAFERYRTRNFRDRVHESEILYQLLVAIHREQVQSTQTSDPIEFGYHFLLNNFRSPLNLKEIAHRCQVSREHFIREFSARYHEPPGAMLRRLRIECAQSMLEATRLSVGDVALASGFASRNSFYRAYRTRFGRSPGSGRIGRKAGIWRATPLGADDASRSHDFAGDIEAATG